MGSSRQRLIALIIKETSQLLRDRRTLMMIAGLPVIELFLFGYAVSLTVYHIPTAVADQSNTAQSREFVRALVNSQYFDVAESVQSEDQIVQAMDAGRAKAGVLIPPDYATKLEAGDADVLILLDGSDSFSVQSGYSAASIVAQSYSVQLAAEKVERAGAAAGPLEQVAVMPVSTSMRVLYNPDLRDLWFILPAIIGMILQSMAVTLAAMAVVRERAAGILEQILATPIRPLELILGKMIPLLGACLAMIAITLGLGIFWFGVPFVGSLWLYLWLALIFIASSLGLGLLISSQARNERQAQQLSQMLMIFSMLLTGLVYPRSAMPGLPQFIGDLIPLTYFIRISRGIITKGVGLAFFWSDAVVLLIYVTVVTVMASFLFRNRLD